MDIKKNKNMLIVVAVILVLLVVGFLVTRSGGSDKDRSKADSLPDVELVPTVGPEVKVSLSADAKKQEVTLEIEGVPDKTEFIEYELTYNKIVEKESVPDGAIGTIEFDGEDPVVREITLGTCSAKVCKYHEGVEKVKVTLKFQGEYGAQLFEGEFEI